MINAGQIHLDHVGSLLRPMALRQARERLLGTHDADHNLGPHTNAALRAIEDEHVRDVVRFQEDIGLDIVTDGDFRRRSWWTDFFLSLTGIRISYMGRNPLRMINAAGEVRPMAGIEVFDRIAWRRSSVVDGFRFLKSVTSRVPKVTLPGPPMVHFLRDRDFVPSVYPDMDAFWQDMVAAYRAELKALAEAGCRFVQIDECMLAFLCDPRHRDMSRSRGEDPDALIRIYTEVIDQAVAERPRDMLVAMHMCRGNMNAFWGAAGGYDLVADAVFNMRGIDILLLEYDTERAGDFRPLARVPKGKQVLLGLVSTKDRRLEDRDHLLRRVEAAAKEIDLQQLGVCPQCGFSTNLFGTDFSIDDERRKLELLVAVKRQVWG